MARVLIWLAATVAATVAATGSEEGCEEAGLFQIKRGTPHSSDVPFGANLGGWLCLEDWFFSGHEGRFVSTSNDEGQGVCLPPLLQGGAKKWPSEGILVKRLNDTYGPLYAAQVFQAHRNSFITEGDVQDMAEIGLTVVRVPVTWALFADALAALDAVYGAHDPQHDSVVVPDPFYPERISMVTIPRSLLETLFRLGHKYGLKFLLDLHAFPGGSSQGTYNGIYPLEPIFWLEKTKLGNATGPDLGHLIFKKAVEWLQHMDGDARAAIHGISPMNEPGHLAGFANPSFAPLEDILDWLAKSTEIFRKSGLAPEVKLYMNLISTGFPDNSFWKVAPAWWEKVTSAKEREAWAIMDIHWYTAWGRKAGMLALDGSVKVTCNAPVDEILENLTAGLVAYAEKFSGNFTGLKACSEFSSSTNADALNACQDVTLTKAWMQLQAKVMSSHQILPYFWSFKMPYGKIFESGWSLRKLYGKNEDPPYSCATNAGILGASADVPCFAGDC